MGPTSYQENGAKETQAGDRKLEVGSWKRKLHPLSLHNTVSLATISGKGNQGRQCETGGLPLWLPSCLPLNEILWGQVITISYMLGNGNKSVLGSSLNMCRYE
jgi:hypothetical protein